MGAKTRKQKGKEPNETTKLGPKEGRRWRLSGKKGEKKNLKLGHEMTGKWTGDKETTKQTGEEARRIRRTTLGHEGVRFGLGGKMDRKKRMKTGHGKMQRRPKNGPRRNHEGEGTCRKGTKVRRKREKGSYGLGGAMADR
ncbi:hypothetical protein OIU85_017839 [Salix viminalis]|uniref:Uncharacterized protein n=1 Tax=Salix viminalis TaxID=40686 RepID=A0A9Q0NIB5_SALVM|nr:hypothetical protein OIU85_017839 [Salix viminalis]